MRPMGSFQRPRGTRDLLPGTMQRREAYLRTVRALMHGAGYGEVLTPTFEHLELFEAKSGAGIRDELYAFDDKSGRKLTLRPELTAAVMRAYLEEMTHLPKPLKLYYIANCFRYERPQAGRYREFWQIGAELLGADPLLGDVETIALAWRCLQAAGVETLHVRLGHLGLVRGLLAEGKVEQPEPVLRLLDKGDRQGLQEHLLTIGADEVAAPLLDLLAARSAPSQEQLQLATELSQSHPSILPTVGHLQRLLALLHHANVPSIHLDLAIARGFDYYTGMVFEVDVPTLGAEKQVCGGGAYDLLEAFGGVSTPTTGFAIGIDRMLLAQEQTRGAPAPLEALDVLVVPLAPQAIPLAWQLVTKVRDTTALSVEVELAGRNLGKALKYADARATTVVVIIGEREVAAGEATLRWLSDGTQRSVPIDLVAATLRAGDGSAQAPLP